jgi:aquaporin Z
MYSGVQIVAGILAGIAYTILFWDSFNLAPAKDFGWLNAGLAELLYTFVLVFVVLNVAASRAVDENKNEYYGLAIGFVVVAGAYGAGAVSGGCFNPAVAIGIDLASWDLGVFWSMFYVGFEILGAALACVLFKVCRPEEFIRTGDPSIPSEPKIGTKMACEFIGSYILVLTVGLNVLAASPAAAFSIAASLMCAIFALGGVSGGHFNPAVTIAVVAASATSAVPADKKFEPSHVARYIAAQVAGGVAAAGTYVLIYAGRSFPLGGDAELSGHKWGQIFVAELVFTFTLCLVVLCVAASGINGLPNYFGLAIGSCVTVGGFAIGGISGGSLNPAVSFGIGTGAGLTASFSLFQQLLRALTYSIAEILGGLLAAAVFVSTHGAMSDAADPEKRSA